MRKYLTYPILASILLVSACNSSNKTESQEHHDHTHEGHDHSAHQSDHPTNPQTPVAQQPQKPEPITAIPDFKFYKIKSGFGFEKTDIPSGKNTVFVLFDPSCGHCQQEAQALAKNYDKIKDVNIFYVSMNDPALMVNFLPSFGKELDGKANVEVLYDRDQEFIRKFHIPNIFPANYVYGPDGQLKTYWEGEKNINDILAAFVN